MSELSPGNVVADLTLARRLEAADAAVGLNSAEIFAKLHPESGAMAEAIAGGYAVFVGVGSPLTQALGVGLQGPVTPREADHLEEFFLSRGAQPLIELCPLADPSLLGILSRRRYFLRDFSNMMVRKLRVAEPPLSSDARTSVQLCTLEEADLWARTVARGLGEVFAQTPEHVEALRSLVHRPTAKCVLAWYAGRPAGGGALSVEDGVAAIYGASTLPPMRRLGIQTAVISALISYAFEAKCDLAYTLTRPGSTSQRNLERQGFRVAYTRSTMVKEESPG
jgi:GNAT superfamily N-acetyltransferase